MKSILCGIVAIAIMSLLAWAIAPWVLLAWFTRNYQVDVKISPKDEVTKTVEVEVSPGSSPETTDLKLELEDYWQDDEPVAQVIQVETPKPVEEIQEIPVETEEPVEAEPALAFPPCPKNLQKLTTRQLQLLCGEINKIKRNSIRGYRNKKDKDRQEIIAKIEAFYQTI